METENVDIRRLGVTRRWSDAVIHGSVVYFVEVPDDPSASARDQFRQVLDQVDARLALVGSNRTRLLQVMVYLPDPADLSEFNSLWDDWVPEGHAPSRACIHAQLAAKGYRIELVVTAAIEAS
jgi:enamine deaminase RidA (YjgF/YER057c/UK114 family)